MYVLNRRDAESPKRPLILRNYRGLVEFARADVGIERISPVARSSLDYGGILIESEWRRMSHREGQSESFSRRSDSRTGSNGFRIPIYVIPRKKKNT